MPGMMLRPEHLFSLVNRYPKKPMVIRNVGIVVSGTGN